MNEQDTLAIYCQQASETPLLTIKDEISLARRVKKGDELAKMHMIQANLRLVIKLAMGFKHFGVPVTDLIAEGNKGLIRAVEKFDPKMGKFSTYAAWWIKQGIQRALINQGRTIRVPVHLISKLGKMGKIENKLREELGRDPTNEEIALEMGIPTKKVTILKEATTKTASLSAPMGQDEDAGTLEDVLPDENTSRPDEELETQDKYQDIHRALNRLDPRAADILRFRFGMGNNKKQTLESIGRKYKVTRERIRQIEFQAMREIRKILSEKKSKSAKSKELEELAEEASKERALMA